MSYIESGKKEGARLVLGGKRVGTKGFFIEPTIFADLKDEMTIAKEEIFGPVMGIFKYHSNEEVIERMNSSRYGLGAGVVTENASEAIEFTRKIRAGTVYVNCYNVFGATTPFGGYKDSGLGRELGEAGIANYLELKTIIQHRGY
jgi:aldehyde dehydrogenase (NAD+)